ncbi:hypothetical protein HYQ46_003401 [Verticillium longisporum]|nr:hypothetical protein HYQ46_003401 [Verticillium longisporum]
MCQVMLSWQMLGEFSISACHSDIRFKSKARCRFLSRLPSQPKHICCELYARQANPASVRLSSEPSVVTSGLPAFNQVAFKHTYKHPSPPRPPSLSPTHPDQDLTLIDNFCNLGKEPRSQIPVPTMSFFKKLTKEFEDLKTSFSDDKKDEKKPEESPAPQHQSSDSRSYYPSQAAQPQHTDSGYSNGHGSYAPNPASESQPSPAPAPDGPPPMAAPSVPPGWVAQWNAHTSGWPPPGR